MQPKHMHKCPGPYKMPYGVMYDLISVKSEKEEADAKAKGWHETLEDAAKACGPSCIYRKPKKKRRGVNKYASGLPDTAPAKVEPVVEVEATPMKKEEPKVEEKKPTPKPKKGNKPKLTAEQREEIVYLLEAGKSNSEIAKKYKVTPQTISLIKKKNGL